MKIILDPGHGGTNKGCNVDGGWEKDYTLEFSLLLARMLAEDGHCVQMTRCRDVVMPLPQRGKFTKQLPCDLVLVLHVDANNGGTGGMAVYWPGNATGHKYAAKIAVEFPLPLIVIPAPVDMDADWEQRVCNVIAVHESTAILLELFNSDNQHDLRFAMSDGGRIDMARAICNAFKPEV